MNKPKHVLSLPQEDHSQHRIVVGGSLIEEIVRSSIKKKQNDADYYCRDEGGDATAR
jgi:hypothetical protein